MLTSSVRSKSEKKLKHAEESLEFFHQVQPDGKHPRALPVNVHGHGEGYEDQLDDADPDENHLGAVTLEPGGEEQAEDQAVHDVLGEVQRDESLARVLAVAVDAEGDGGRRAEGAAEGDNAEEDGRHDPGVMDLGGPAEAHEPDDRGDGYGSGHHETELRLVQPTVASGHRANDDVADLPGDGGANDTADEGG